MLHTGVLPTVTKPHLHTQSFQSSFGAPFLNTKSTSYHKIQNKYNNTDKRLKQKSVGNRLQGEETFLKKTLSLKLENASIKKNTHV